MPGIVAKLVMKNLMKSLHLHYIFVIMESNFRQEFVELLVGEGMCHVYPLIPDRESAKAIKSMRNFVEKCLL